MPALDDATRIHDRDAVAEARDDAWIVRDEQHGETAVALELRKHVEVLRLQRDVERGRRLVRDQQLAARDAVAIAPTTR